MMSAKVFEQLEIEILSCGGLVKAPLHLENLPLKHTLGLTKDFRAFDLKLRTIVNLFIVGETA